MTSTSSSSVVVYHNGKVATMDDASSLVEALAVDSSTGLILATGSSSSLLSLHPHPAVHVDLHGRTVIPGLIDSHLHFIREGNHFTLELRWDGVRSLSHALHLLAEQAQRTPLDQWVRVVGGWCEAQFDEKRLPTLEELDAAGHGRPVFVLHLYDCALVNARGMQLLGYTKDTPNPPSGELVRHADGSPTGVLIARPNAFLLYNTLDQLPKLSDADKRSSTLAYARELNRFGVTSCLDPGGGFQAYPKDYSIIQQLDDEQLLTVRIAYSLFPQRPQHELEDFQRWADMVTPGQGSPFLRHLGAGEMLAFSAADFEDFKEARPDLPHHMEGDLEPIVRFLASKRWPFRLHATYGESIERELAIFEKIEADVPGSLTSLRWFIDHAETVSKRDIARIQQLGGGIAVQHRMAFQGEYFVQRYGADVAKHSPPLHWMRQSGVHLGGGTDGTRVATYNPFVSLQWLVTGSTVGGLVLSPPNASGCDADSNCFSRMDALRLWTSANAWFCHEEQLKGRLTPGMYADFAVLHADYFEVSAEQIGQLEAELTVVNGRVVYVDPAQRTRYAGVELPVEYSPASISPPWSPVRFYGGYQLLSSSAWPADTTQPAPLGAQSAASDKVAQRGGCGRVEVAPANPLEFFQHGHDC